MATAHAVKYLVKAGPELIEFEWMCDINVKCWPRFMSHLNGIDFRALKNRNVNHCQSLGSMQGFNLALLSIIHRGVDLRRRQSSQLIQMRATSNDGPEAASAVKGSAKISAHLMILPYCIIGI